MQKTKNSYKKSGVNIDLANEFVKHISKISKKNVKKKKAPQQINNIGAFGSLYDLSKSKIKDPVIVSSTDGVGTKLELANKFKKFDTIGIDLVAMCVNDLIVQGAKPLFFLDYMAIGKINLKKMKLIIKGIMKGCNISECQLAGGETAEMPGVYEKNKFDLAGFSVGIASKRKLLTQSNVKNHDVILGIPSNGLHSNGFSLLRNILKKRKINKKLEKQILKPTKIYVKEILNLVNRRLISSAAHITGGGLIENISRSVPNGLSINIDLKKIKTLEIFKWLKKNNVSDSEMLRTFNCGIGFCVILKRKNVNKIKKFFTKEFKPYEIGYISNSKSKVNLFNKIQW